MAKKKVEVKKVEVKIGDTIPIREDIELHVKVLVEAGNSAQMLARFAGDNMRDANTKLWDFINEMHPELKDFKMVLQSDKDKERVLLITGRNFDGH